MLYAAPRAGRQPRLSIMEAATVDNKRRLVLVRRDHVEHLVMIGGPSDIVVEPNIIRGRPATSALARSKQLAAQRAHAQNAQIQAAHAQAAQAQAAQAQRPAQLHSTQHPPHGATDRQMPAAIASTSAAAMAAAVLSRPDEAGSPVGQTATARLVPTEQGGEMTERGSQEPPQFKEQPRLKETKEQEADTSEPAVIDPAEAAPIAQAEDKADRETEYTETARHAAELPEVSVPETAEREIPPAESPDSEAQRATEVPGAQQQFEEQPSLADADPAATDTVDDQADPDPMNEEPADPDDLSGTITVASLAAGAAALAAAAGSKSPSDDTATGDIDPTDSEVESAAQANGEFAEDEAKMTSALDPMPVASEEQELLDAVLESVDEAAAIDADVDTDPVEAHEALKEQAESQDSISDPGMMPADIPPAGSFDTQGLDPVDQLDVPTADATSPVVASSKPETSHGADPYADLESDFKRAFETSLRGLKDKVHGEPAQASEDLAPVEPSETMEAPEPTEAPFPAENEIESLTSAVDHLTTESDEQATPSVASQDHGFPAHSAEVELLHSVSPDKLAPDSEIDEESSPAPPEDAGRQDSELPPELAFLDAPANEGSPGQMEEHAPELDAEDDESAAAVASSENEETPVGTGDDEPAPVVRNAEPDFPPEPTPGQNPFPTIPESVRKSVMAAASRAIPPELAAGLADGMDKDVATTTLGDLAQRLEKALSEQSEAQTNDDLPDDTDASDPLPGLASGHEDDDQTNAPNAVEGSDDESDHEPEADEREEGAVIDFNALRREEAEETLEDEMAKLLNDLASDANKAS